MTRPDLWARPGIPNVPFNIVFEIIMTPIVWLIEAIGRLLCLLIFRMSIIHRNRGEVAPWFPISRSFCESRPQSSSDQRPLDKLLYSLEPCPCECEVSLCECTGHYSLLLFTVLALHIGMKYAKFLPKGCSQDY